jgi:two-component system response regulator HydG
MPALRERGDDVLLLAEHFVGSINHAKQPIAGFSTPAKQALRSYSWPGNIRELRNAVERALALAKGSQIELHDLPTMLWQSTAVIDSGPRENNSAEEASPPDQAVAGQSRGEAIASADAQYIDELLRQHHGNVSRAARQAGMSRQSLHKLLIKHGLRAADYRT